MAAAIEGRLGLGRLSDVGHPYPTRSEAIRKLGDAYQRTRLTPRARRWIGRWLVLGRLLDRGGYSAWT